MENRIISPTLRAAGAIGALSRAAGALGATARRAAATVIELIDELPVRPLGKAAQTKADQKDGALKRAKGTATNAPRIERLPANQGGGWVPTTISHYYDRATYRAKYHSKRYTPNGARECARRAR